METEPIECDIPGCMAEGYEATVCRQHLIEFNYWYCNEYAASAKLGYPPTTRQLNEWIAIKEIELLGELKSYSRDLPGKAYTQTHK